MSKKEKDYRETTLNEALDWVNKNCKFDDVRKRIRSRAVAWVLFKKLQEATVYINHLEDKIKQLENDNG